ncbi:kinetoplast-associated KAP protein [Rutstroemia sp. NJR-2017a BVV2]|nr:kinetoplast-associated KAP protein [Rutstroemia sp. NJR-2017a BVV2]
MCRLHFNPHYIISMPPSQSFPSPPPAYVNPTAEDSTGTPVLLDPALQPQLLCRGITPTLSNIHPEENHVSVNSIVENRDLTNTESTVIPTSSRCAVATSSGSEHDKLVSRLEEVIQALEKEDKKSSPEDKLISRLEKVIRHNGHASISEGKRDTRKPIKLKDAVGRRFSFPYYRCETWAGIEELIKQAFLHVEIIGRHVQEGHYDLMNPAGEVILPQVWEDHVEPGWSISMSMWPMPDSMPRPPPPPVHAIVDRGPPHPGLPPPSFPCNPPPRDPPPPPPFHIHPITCPKKRTSDFDSFISKKKGFRGLWRNLSGIFRKKILAALTNILVQQVKGP